jgi:polyisoprenyl-phosphate glycosyltransferase
MTAAPPVLAIVMPCYNEEAALPETARRLDLLLDRMIADCLIDPASTVYPVDDRSHDATGS